MRILRSAHICATRARAVLVGAAWSLVAVTNAACYSYVPLAAPAARDGDVLRVRLTPSGTVDLARYIGPRVVALDGQLLRASADSGLTIAVTELRASDGTRTLWAGDAPLLISPLAVAGLERRELSRRRTILTSAVAATGVVTLGVVAVRRGGKESPGGGPPPPPPP
jgi:hypothetical protein